MKRLDEETDLSIRRALLLSLGEFGEQELAPEARKGLLPELQVMYRTASDPGSSCGGCNDFGAMALERVSRRENHFTSGAFGLCQE
jgi:hypothetical protein